MREGGSVWVDGRSSGNAALRLVMRVAVRASHAGRRGARAARARWGSKGSLGLWHAWMLQRMNGTIKAAKTDQRQKIRLPLTCHPQPAYHLRRTHLRPRPLLWALLSCPKRSHPLPSPPCRCSYSGRAKVGHPFVLSLSPCLLGDAARHGGISVYLRRMSSVPFTRATRLTAATLNFK